LNNARWLRVVELQPNQMIAAADPAGVGALIKLQHVLLAKHSAGLSWAAAAPSAVDAAHQQQLQAALAGSRDAYALILRLLSKSCSQVQLRRHAAALAAVLQAEPWLRYHQQQQQQQQEEEDGALQPQSDQHSVACLIACSLLCKMVSLKHHAAVAEACRDLPAYMQQLLLGAAAAASSSTGAMAGTDSNKDATVAESVAAAAAAAAGSSGEDAAEPQPGAGDAAASAGTVSEADAAATAAFLRWLLLSAANPSTAAAQGTVLGHAVVASPALVIAALQQEEVAFGQQLLFAQLLMRALRGCYVKLLLKAAVEKQVAVQQLVSALLQYAVDNFSSSTCSGDGINTSSSSSTGDNQADGPGLAAAAADLLWKVLAYCGRHPWVEAVAAVLAEPARTQLLLRALQQAVMQAPDNSGDDAKISSLARVLRGICLHDNAAVELQITAVLQELMQLAVQQGNRLAATALAVLAKPQPLLQRLLPHTPELLQALRPGKPCAVQAAALHVLEAWAGTEQGRTAVLQQDWLCIAEVMVQQGGWINSIDTADTAAAAAAGSDSLNDPALASWCSQKCIAAEIAARIVERLVPFGIDQLETEDCVRKLLQAVVCPPAAAEHGGSSSCSSSAMDTGCSSSSMPGADGTAAGNSSSSSSMHRKWSVTVAEVAIDALSLVIVESEVGFAAAAKHVSLLLLAMQNTQHAYIAGKAGELALDIAREGELDHICTPKNIDKLLAVLQQPISDPTRSVVVETAAEILSMATQPPGLQLLAEQGRYDTLVRATQHQNDKVAKCAADIVMTVTLREMWLPSDCARKAAQGQADQQQHQQGGADNHAAQQVQQDQVDAADQQQQEQQIDQADSAAAVPTSETAAPVPQRWHIQLLAEAAQNPVLAIPAIKACAYIADSRGAYALMLAPYRSVLKRAARRLQGLVGVDWEGLNQCGVLSDEQVTSLTGVDQPAVDQLQGYVDFVLQAAEQVTAKVATALAGEVWEQRVAAVQFALLWRGSESQQQSANRCVRKQARMGRDDSTTLAATTDVVEVSGEREVQAAGAGSGGNCRMIELQQQLMAALCALVTHSKWRTNLQQMVQAAQRQL
jgi:hypothetical protein